MLHTLQHSNSVSSLKPTSLWILAALFSPAVTIIALSRFTLQPSIFQDKEYRKYYYILSNIVLVHLPKMYIFGKFAEKV